MFKEEEKCNEIRDFLIDKVFINELSYARKHNDKIILNFASKTINEMYDIKSVKKLIGYYKNIIRCETEKLKFVSNYLKVRHITRLEDIEKEFLSKFNSKWLKE